MFVLQREAGQASARHVEIVLGEFPPHVNKFWIYDFLFVYTNYKLDVDKISAMMPPAFFPHKREKPRIPASARPAALIREHVPAFRPIIPGGIMPLSRTTLRATEILNLLAARPDGMTISEISVELRMPKTSAFDIVQTLRKQHFLREARKRFTIGYMAHEVGVAYQPDKDLYGIVRPALSPLGDEFGMTASLVFYEDDGLVYALEYRPASSIISSGASSGHGFLHASASGKVLLAFMPEPKLARALKKIHFTAITERTITSEEAFLHELEEVRKRGYALDLREFNPLQTCVSAPILQRGQALAAVTLSGLQVDESHIPFIADRLIRAARSIEGKLVMQESRE